jgi:hypothetical protein
MSDGQRDHFKGLVSSTLDTALANGHGHLMEPDDLYTFDSIEARRAMRLRQVQIGRRMQLVASAALRELEQKLADGKPLDLSRQQAEQLREVGEEMERRGMRDPGDAPVPPTGKPN